MRGSIVPQYLSSFTALCEYGMSKNELEMPSWGSHFVDCRPKVGSVVIETCMENTPFFHKEH